MPHMSPILWFNIFMIMIVFIMFIMSLIYFHINLIPSNSFNLKKENKILTWLW
uniref:ATP synthase F0 subunit 8 n=1 Tax=Smilium sinense TaxID=1380519 RepID=UPI0021CC72CC|nr:ATP synthase F0 subunit 8 [Smilium sinense]UWM12986.1 ATP synthase F0 subunit 8 [Smilium sinense]